MGVHQFSVFVHVSVTAHESVFVNVVVVAVRWSCWWVCVITVCRWLWTCDDRSDSATPAAAIIIATTARHERVGQHDPGEDRAEEGCGGEYDLPPAAPNCWAPRTHNVIDAP